MNLEHAEAELVKVAVLVHLIHFKRVRVNVLREEIRDIVGGIRASEA